MLSCKVEIITPLMWFAPDSSPSARESAVTALLSLSTKISIKSINGENVPIEISELIDPKMHKDYFSEADLKQSPVTIYRHVVFSQSIQYDEKAAAEYFSSAEDMSARNARYLYECFAEEHLAKSVVDILLAANIASPGSVCAIQLYSFISSGSYISFRDPNTSFYLTHNGVGNTELPHIFESERLRSWPPITKIEILDVYRWLERIEGFEYGAPKTPLGRAYSALSYLMGDLGEDSYSRLFWSMMALESLYCIGTTGLKEQLNSKTEAFLGSKSEYKKDFSAAYDYRSRFIHGDIDIVFRHHIYDGSPEKDRFYSERSEAEGNAVAVLFSTFQMMCSQNKHELAFRYEVLDS